MGIILLQWHLSWVVINYAVGEWLVVKSDMLGTGSDLWSDESSFIVLLRKLRLWPLLYTLCEGTPSKSLYLHENPR